MTGGLRVAGLAQFNTTAGIGHILESADAGVTWTSLSTSWDSARFVINGYPQSAQFADGAPVVEALAGLVDVPSTANFSDHSSGVAGYARTASTSTGAVGTYGQGRAAAASTSAWGGNFVVENKAFAASNLQGVEVDVNQTNSGGTAAVNVTGVAVTGASDSQASGTFAAFIAQPAGIFTTPKIKWKNAFISASGAANSGLALFQQDVTGNSPSQFIEMYGNDGGGLHLGLIQVAQNGEFDLRQASGANISLQKSDGTHWLDVDSAGKILVTDLKTTGSAGSKKVVCVDTVTGQLYASSTGTDCSN